MADRAGPANFQSCPTAKCRPIAERSIDCAGIFLYNVVTGRAARSEFLPYVDAFTLIARAARRTPPAAFSIPRSLQQMKKELFLEDFATGQVVASPQRLRVEKDDIIAFAKKFDPQYFHLDEEAARRSIFGGLVASGWHTAAMTMRLLTERDTVPAGGSIGLGCDELRWPIPVRPGDELHIETEVLEVRPSKSRPERGLVKMRTRTLNQRGEVVQEIINNAMVPRRPTSEKQ